MASIDELLNALMEALNAGLEVTVTIRKPAPNVKAENTVTCQKCGWRHSYTRAANARRGYEAHSKSCPGGKRAAPQVSQWLKDQTEGKEL